MSDIPPTQALDRVLYLAQLVSTPRDIDPILDVVRAITAKRKSSGTLLSDAEVVQLEQAYTAIKDYLLYKDPLRNFTEAELERKVNRALNPELQGPLVRWPWLIIASIWLLYIGCAMLAYLQTESLPIAMGSGMALLLIVIPLLFLLPLKAFRPELRRAYMLICLGVVATAIAGAPLSAVQFFPDLLLDHPLFKHATGIALFLLGTIPYYAGIARFARLQNVRSRLLSPAVMAGLLLAVIGIVALLPHPAIASNRLLYDIPIVGLTFNAIFAVPS